ncbi:hypothetical protein [Fusobacterium gonidiaformans]|nr:hypothetical protein [Fusobacterium gonidiaformans]
MIIYDKAIRVFTRKQLREMLPILSGRVFLREKKINLEISVRIPYKKIGYTVEDMLKDYPSVKKYSELKLFYNIHASGYNLNSLTKKYNLVEGALGRILESKVSFEGNAKNFHYILDYSDKVKEFIWDNYEIIPYKDHTEIFSTVENLKEFKEQFDIEREILLEPFEKKYHIAFGGNLSIFLNRKIKNAEN